MYLCRYEQTRAGQKVTRSHGMVVNCSMEKKNGVRYKKKNKQIIDPVLVVGLRTQ